MLLAAVAAAVGTYWFQARTINMSSTAWHDLTRAPADHLVGFTGEALGGGDIPLPRITGLKGRWKFLERDGTHFGYLITVSVDKLDKTKIPEKYKKTTTEDTKAGDFIIQPIEEVVYTGHFVFTFKDKDGFILLTLNSQPHDIISGRQNQYQAVIAQPLSQEISKLTHEAIFSINVDKCETCT
jgi:hypothetical protein